jgi:hypothetical protein
MFGGESFVVYNELWKGRKFALGEWLSALAWRFVGRCVLWYHSLDFLRHLNPYRKEVLTARFQADNAAGILCMRRYVRLT